MEGARFRRPGVIVNARAGRIRREPELLERLSRLSPAELLHVTEGPEEVGAALESLRDAGADAVAIIGGDGSATGTLTPLVEAWSATGRPLPAVALLPGGSVNTLAHALGGRGAPDRLLARLVTEPEAARERPVTLLHVQAGDRPASLGLIFGTGAVARWLGVYYSQARRGASGAALCLARTFGSIAARGTLARDLFARFDAKVEIDGEPAPLEWFTAMAAGAVPDIGLGLRPFHSAGRRHRFHWIMTDAGPSGMALEVAGVALRLRFPLSRLQHASAARVTVRAPHPLPYTVDGDLFPPASSLEVASGPEIRFLSP